MERNRSPVPRREPGSPRAPQADRRDTRPRPRLPPGPPPLSSESDTTDVDEEYRERSPYWQPFPEEPRSTQSPPREPLQESQRLWEDDDSGGPAAPVTNRRDTRPRPKRQAIRRYSTSSESDDDSAPAAAGRAPAVRTARYEHVSETPESDDERRGYSSGGDDDAYAVGSVRTPSSGDEEAPPSPEIILSSQPTAGPNDDATLAILDSWQSPANLTKARHYLGKVRDTTWDTTSHPGEIILSVYIPRHVDAAVAMRPTPTLTARVWGTGKLVVATTQGTHGRRDYAKLKEVVAALESIRPLMPTFLYPLRHMQAAGFVVDLARTTVVSRRSHPVEWTLFEDLSGVRPYLNRFVVERNAPNCMMTFLQYIDDERTPPTEVLLCVLQVLCALEAAQRCVAYVNWRFSVNSVGMRDFTRMRDRAYLEYYVGESHVLRMCPNAVPVIVRHTHARLELSNHDNSIWSVDVENFVKSLYSSTTRHASLLQPLEEHINDLAAQGQGARPMDVLAWMLGHYRSLEQSGECALRDVDASAWDRRPSSVVVWRTRAE